MQVGFLRTVQLEVYNVINSIQLCRDPVGSTLPLIDRLRIIRDLAEGLAFLHSQAIVHRDVRLANGMVS